MGIRAKQVDFLLGGVEHQDQLLVGGKVFFYQPGTTNLATIYGSADKTVVAQNPVILNAQASAEIFLDGVYDLRIEDSTGALVNTIEGVDYQVIPSQGKTPVNISTNYNAPTANLAIYANTAGGALTVNLPTAVGRLGEEIFISKTTADANAVTVDGAGAETINGAATYTISSGWDYILIASDGANWVITAKYNSAYSDGTAALPSITFTSDPDIGWFRKAANQIGAAIAGALVGFFDAAGWNGNVVGNVQGNVQGNLTGNSSGTHSGPVVGDVQGHVSGSSGSCTGNAATATQAASCTGNAATATQAANASALNGPIFGTRSAEKSIGTVYQAATDVLVCGFVGNASDVARAGVLAYVDTVNPPVALEAFYAGFPAGTENGGPICFPVKKGEYYKFQITTGAVNLHVREIPLGA